MNSPRKNSQKRQGRKYQINRKKYKDLDADYS